MSATSQTTPVPTEPVRQSPYRRMNRGRGNFELWSWVFMRGSGILLLVLVFGHLFVNLMLGEGIHAIDFAFGDKSKAPPGFPPMFLNEIPTWNTFLETNPGANFVPQQNGVPMLSHQTTMSRYSRG